MSVQSGDISLSQAQASATAPAAATANSVAPSISFDPSKAAITDPGLNTTAAIFRYDAATGTLTEIGTNVDAEVAAMLPNSADLDIRVSLTPLYFTPSRLRFYRRGDNPADLQHGIGKEYGSITISLAQRQPLPKLGSALSWSNAWSLVTANSTQDIPDALLSSETDSSTAKDSFTRMPLVDGQAVVGVEFQTGTTNNNFQKLFSSILTPLQGISSDTSNPLALLSITATPVTTAINYLNALSHIVTDVGASKTQISVDMKNGNVRAVAYQNAFDVRGPNTLRLPQGDAIFFFTPSKYVDSFAETLRSIHSNGQRIRLDGTTAQPKVVDANGALVTKTLGAADPRVAALAPLEPFTLVVIGTFVENTAPPTRA
jgi:hypothetical protein